MFKAALDLIGERGDPVVVATSGRSGTHLMMDIIRHQFSDFANWKLPGQSVSAMYVPLDEVARGVVSLYGARRRMRRANRAIFRTHNWPEVLDELRPVDSEMAEWLERKAQVLHLVRNPQLAIAKLWTLTAQFQGWQSVMVDAEAFVAARASRWSDEVNRMKHVPRRLPLRLEDVLENPSREIARIGVFLGSTPRFRSPLLIPPNRHHIDTRIGRLHFRPRSTHIFISERMRRAFPLEWTINRLALLDANAGEAMEIMGYRRPS